MVIRVNWLSGFGIADGPIMALFWILLILVAFALVIEDSVPMQ